MNNQVTWQETKYLITNNNLTINNKSYQLHPKSWIITECVAQLYGQYLPSYAKGDILDLGCGMCPLYGYYKQFSSSVFCIDWENSLHTNPYIDLACDINNSIPLEGNLFDTVILSDVLEHIAKPQNLLSEINRLLKQEGVLIMNVPFLYWIHEAPYDFYRYTEFSLKDYLKSSGFKLEIFEVVGGALEVWADITAKLSFYIPILGKFLPQFLFYSIFMLKNNGYVQRKFEVLDQTFPLGYFVVARKA